MASLDNLAHQVTKRRKQKVLCVLLLCRGNEPFVQLFWVRFFYSTVLERKAFVQGFIHKFNYLNRNKSTTLKGLMFKGIMNYNIFWITGFYKARFRTNCSKSIFILCLKDPHTLNGHNFRFFTLTPTLSRRARELGQWKIYLFSLAYVPCNSIIR